MKVVLFCGGQGMRLREYSETIPKPMVTLGYRPILWHVMRYYAHFGHRDFILCLGHRADVIKKYFRTYDESLSNDFVLTAGGRNVQMLGTDIEDWRITFVDTGLNSSIGERLVAVRSHLEGEEMFLANYADGVSDLHLPTYLDWFRKSGKVGAFLAVPPSGSFHVVQIGTGGLVREVRHVSASDVKINGGFFAFRREIFDYIKPGEELVNGPFLRLIEQQQLVAYPHQGFWACMDTFKEKQALDELCLSGKAPWELWRKNGTAGA